MSVFMRVKLDCAYIRFRLVKKDGGIGQGRKLTLMKVEEVEKRKENGRHWRKLNELVMLLKKLRHDELEKFCVKIESNAWGKGVGSGGGEVGMVGKSWDTTGTDRKNSTRNTGHGNCLSVRRFVYMGHATGEEGVHIFLWFFSYTYVTYAGLPWRGPRNLC